MIMFWQFGLEPWSKGEHLRLLTPDIALALALNVPDRPSGHCVCVDYNVHYELHKVALTVFLGELISIHNGGEMA